MKLPVVVRASADADIDEVLDHYRREAPSQVPRMLADLESAFDRIERNPRAASPRYALELDVPGLRSVQLKRFPYLIVYLEGETESAVLRVLHQSRELPLLVDVGPPRARSAVPAPSRRSGRRGRVRRSGRRRSRREQRRAPGNVPMPSPSSSRGRRAA